MTQKRCLLLCILLLLASLPGAGLLAQSGGESLAPPAIPGEAVYIPFPVAITLDGQLDDWAGVPSVTVDQPSATSPDPEASGQFTFALAASEDTLYITMTTVDDTIITGEHGSEYWNEDSLEFYFNLTDDVFTTAYASGIFQVNINPGDSGNSDPTDLTLTGTRSNTSGATGYVFATEDGWGFEAAVPLPFTPEHGREIGVQAHANGSDGGNRNLKLIWSAADTGDTSYSDPSVFGRGLFFEIGQDEVPMPSVYVEPPLPPGLLHVNQVGYFASGPKLAVYATAAPTEGGLPWALAESASGEVVLEGALLPGQVDMASGDYVHVIDFSSVTAPGEYLLRANDVSSVPFTIGDDVLAGLPYDALAYFYRSRSGTSIEAQYAGEAWARPAGHLSDSAVTCYSGTDAEGTTWDGCDYTLDASGGWYDAGDYGKYVVNGGITVWTLFNLYEFLPDAFGDGSLHIPESGNGVPDILDEARWEMQFMLGMQVPEGEPQAGMVHHKLHNLAWDGLPLLPPTEDDRGRTLMPPSTAATLNLAATAAQCARLWRPFDADFADRCLAAAERAWQAAGENPVFTYGNIPGDGGGNYDDADVDDEFFWAAVELYITTGAEEYYRFLQESPFFTENAGWDRSQEGAMYWGDVASLGTIALAMTQSSLSEEERALVQEQVTAIANNYVTVARYEGYRMPMPRTGYSWGSNANLLNNALVAAYAYEFSGQQRFLDLVVESMNYLLGRNALGFSFVSGYGETAMQHPHHRFWADSPPDFPPVPPGVVAGGPNATPADPPAMAPEVAGRAPAKRYVDHVESYSTNEVAINWNAPLVWVSAYLDHHFNGGE